MRRLTGNGTIIAAVAILVCAPFLLRSHIEEERQAAAQALLAEFPASPGAGDLRILRAAYSASSETWPKPKLHAAVTAHRELAALEIRRPRAEGHASLAALGQTLFEDPVLSLSGQISCQSCHNRRLGWGDGLPTSFGHDRQEGQRNALPLFNASYRETLFWDGRAPDLASQALFPMLDPVEMANHDSGEIVARVEASGKYREVFKALFNDAQASMDKIKAALVAFQSGLERETSFDRFMKGEHNRLSDQQIWGLHLFRTKAGCANCHNGPLLADEQFHNIGLSYYGRRLEDLGRYNVSADPSDAGSFRTPSLRHVSKTGPYMHNGVFPRLEGVVNLYAAGGGRVRSERAKSPDDPLFPHASENSPLLEPFKLTGDERAALVAFLNAL